MARFVKVKGNCRVGAAGAGEQWVDALRTAGRQPAKCHRSPRVDAARGCVPPRARRGHARLRAACRACQALEYRGRCCHGFGTRAVDVLNSDFVDEDPDWWHVFEVSSECGRTDGHFFYKLVTLPQGTYGYGRRGCAALGWSWVGEFCAGSALERLADALEPYLEEYNRSSDFHHVHLGIKMEKLYAPRR